MFIFGTLSALTTMSSAMFAYNIMLCVLMGVIAYWIFQINHLFCSKRKYSFAQRTAEEQLMPN